MENFRITYERFWCGRVDGETIITSIRSDAAEEVPGGGRGAEIMVVDCSRKKECGAFADQGRWREFDGKACVHPGLADIKTGRRRKL
jgi:hypothetical protein